MLISHRLWLRIAQPRDERGDQTCLLSLLQAGSKNGVEAILVLPRSAGGGQAGWGLGGRSEDTRDGSSDWPARLVRMIRSAAGASSTPASRQDPGIGSHLCYNLLGSNPRGSVTCSLVCLSAEKHLQAVFHSYGAEHGV